MIEVSGLSKFYDGFPAIDGVDFKIDEGEIVGLLGLNGAGKSTILKILGCFLLPSRGSASLCGFDVEQDAYEVRRRIGYLPDTPPLYNEMTVFAYLKYVAALKQVESSSIAGFVDNAIGKTGLESVSTVRIDELSHGFRQRVGIAQAIVHKPRVLIFDEPINGLDPIQIVEMRDLILSLRKEHTVILSSHILSEITRTCDRILIVDKGQMVAEGRESELVGGKSAAAKVSVETKRSLSSDEISNIESLNWVQAVKKIDKNGLFIEMLEDKRDEIAEQIVKSGAGLISMHQSSTSDLEELFMKFVNKGGKS